MTNEEMLLRLREDVAAEKWPDTLIAFRDEKPERREARSKARARLAALPGPALLERLIALVDLEEECSLDHHGLCQAHMLETECSVAAARKAIADAGKALELT